MSSIFPTVRDHVVEGNLTADPDLRFTQGGQQVVNFTVAHTPRIRQEDGSFVDGDTVFYRAEAWRDLADNIAESLTKGTAVLMVGDIVPREYETREGELRTSLDFKVRLIGPSLRFATAEVTRVRKGDRKQAEPADEAPTKATRKAPAKPAQDADEAPAKPTRRATARAGAKAATDDPWA